MIRKVYVNVKTRLILHVDEGVEIDEVMGDMEYDFKANPDYASVMDVEPLYYEVEDSK